MVATVVAMSLGSVGAMVLLDRAHLVDTARVAVPTIFSVWLVCWYVAGRPYRMLVDSVALRTNPRFMIGDVEDTHPSKIEVSGRLYRRCVEIHSNDGVLARARCMGVTLVWRDRMTGWRARRY